MMGVFAVTGARLLLAGVYGHGLDLGGWLVHAVVWSAVWTTMRHAPWLAVAAVAVVVAVVVGRRVLRRRASSRRRP